MKTPILCTIALLLATFFAGTSTQAKEPFSTDGNRFAYLDGPCDPYYPNENFPKLITPQWVGEQGVEAVVILGIDDMRDTAKYEAYLRPILDRLKEIDGRAAVSIMTNKVDPKGPQLQSWLKEGVSLECHTIDHPCPLLKDGDFSTAAKTYQDCVDLLASVPNSKPVAFRMPCCDSLNTVSPKFFPEIFGKPSEKQNHLTIDSSVFMVFTAADKELPQDMLFDNDGSERFNKYLPFPSYVNKIQNYPYPYVINNDCWEFPCMVPSDWEAQNIQKPFNPKTVEDMKAALDLTVIKQGAMNLCFHPHGWIRNDQIVELIDHAVEKHGKKVKFLTFAEAQERIDKNLLAGESLRSKSSFGNPRARIIDVNNDGYMDVVLGRRMAPVSRIWNLETMKFEDVSFPYDFGESTHPDETVIEKNKFRVFPTSDGTTLTYLLRSDATVRETSGGITVGPSTDLSEWEFVDGKWSNETHHTDYGDGDRIGLNSDATNRDFDGDGKCEPSSYFLKEMPKLKGTNHGSHRFVDINEDGKIDLIFSDEKRFGVYLFKDIESGWSITAMEGEHGKSDQHFPVITVNGRNNGAFFHSRHLWVQNEHTAKLPDLVDRISFDDMLKNVAAEYKPKGSKASDESESTKEFPKKNVGQPESNSPENALKTFRTHPELVIELVASEPLIADPVAFDWGVDGSLWVVEMGDYPLGADSEGTFGGKVRHLTDTDGDGKYDQSTVFLDRLPFPTGIKVWRDGVIVSTAPDVFFAKDTDGDGKADERQVLFTGFSEGNQQHRVNGLRWGLDGWLHLANGDSGGEIKSAKTDKTIDIRSSDLAINPETGQMAETFGRTQFGRSRDDWGNWVGGNNSNPMWQYVLDQRKLRLSPHVRLPNVKHHISDKPGASQIFPISKTLERFNDFDRANRFTSACSHDFYRDTFLGKDSDGNNYFGNALICEPVHNMVHREIVNRDGIYLNSTRADCEKESEFLASTDSWFRPVMVRTGPDGAIWVADMYRLVIEHPEWIPEEWQQKLDLQSGSDMGRIYRIYRKGTRPKIPNLADADGKQLTEAMKSENGTVRDIAHQLLLENGTGSATRLIRASKAESVPAQARLQLLHAAQNVLDKTMRRVHSKADFLNQSRIAEAALSDADPFVRAFGVSYCNWLLRGKRIADKLEAADHGRWKSDLPMSTKLRALFDDKDQRVQLEFAYSYRNLAQLFSDDSLLFKLIATNQHDAIMLATTISNINSDNADSLATMPWHELNESAMRNFLTVLIKSGDANQVTNRLVDTALKEPGVFESETQRLEVLSTIQSAIVGRKIKLDENQQAGLNKWRTRAREIVRKKMTPGAESDEAFDAAISVVGIPNGQTDDDRKLLIELLNVAFTPELQAAGISQLSRNGSDEVGEQLISLWSNATPAIRTQILNALIRRDGWAELLIKSFESHEIEVTSLDATQLDHLERNVWKELRERLGKVTPLPSSTDRQKIIEDYAKQIGESSIDADATKGQAIFKKNCSSCHKLGKEGTAIGPDLTALTDKSKNAMLVAILDPNRAVEQKYTNYIIETFDGLQYSGVLVQETAASIRLLNADQKEVELTRSDIEEMYTVKKSYMPEGFDRDISVEQMGDLIEFLQSNKSDSKRK